MAHLHRNDAETEEYGFITVHAKAGDTVSWDDRVTITITQEGLDCDCGKGVLCPLNPQDVKGNWHNITHNDVILKLYFYKV